MDKKGSKIPQWRRSSARVSSQSSVDMNKRRKVRFLDPTSTGETIGRQDLPSFLAERVHSPNVDYAKTSEFKTFRRLLEETDRKRHSNQVPKRNDDLKTFEGSDFMRTENEDVTRMSDSKRPLFPVLKVTPITQRSDRISHDLELDNGSKHKHNRRSSLSPIQSGCWKSSTSPEKYSLNCGQKPEYEGIFLAKRKKLLELAAEASTHKVDEILSNKSDMIMELLHRLGAGQKSGNLDKFLKPGQNISSGRCQLPALLEASDDNREIREPLRANIQPTLGGKWEIGIPVDFVEDQAFPTFHALECGSDCQPISAYDELRKSNLLNDKKSLSTAAAGRHQPAGQMLSKGNEMISLPQDYTIVRAFPPSDIMHSGPQGMPWRPNRDDEGNEHKSASTRHYAMGQMLSRASRFDSLSHDHYGVQAFPALECLDTGVQGRRWHSYPKLEKEPSENRSDSTGCYPLFRADELVTFPGDVMLHLLPAKHAIHTGLQGKNDHTVSVLEGISDLHTVNALTSGVGSGIDFEYRKPRCHSGENQLSEFGYRFLENLPSTSSQFKDISVGPYIDSASFYDLRSKNLHPGVEKQLCTLPLLPWSGSMEHEIASHAPEEQIKELDSLPLTPYGGPCVLNRTERLLDTNVYAKTNIFSFSPRPDMELKFNSSTVDFDREHCLSISSKFPFDKEQLDGAFSCSVTRKRNDGWEYEKSLLLEMPSPLQDDLSFSGLRFSMDREKSTFGLLPDGLSW